MLHCTGVRISLARSAQWEVGKLTNARVVVADVSGALIAVAACNLARNLVQDSEDFGGIRRFEIVRGVRIRRYKFHAVLIRNRDISKKQCKDFNAVGGLHVVCGGCRIGQ
jgi:hypothetical protein